MKVFLIWFLFTFAFLMLCIFFRKDYKKKKGTICIVSAIITSAIISIIYAPITLGIIYLIKFLNK